MIEIVRIGRYFEYYIFKIELIPSSRLTELLNKSCFLDFVFLSCLFFAKSAY